MSTFMLDLVQYKRKHITGFICRCEVLSTTLLPISWLLVDAHIFKKFESVRCAKFIYSIKKNAKKHMRCDGEMRTLPLNDH